MDSPLKQVYEIGMRTGLAALAEQASGDRGHAAVSRPSRPTRHTRLRSAATGGAALGRPAKFFQAMASRCTAAGAAELVSLHAASLCQVHPDTTGVAMADNIEIRIENPISMASAGGGAPSQHPQLLPKIRSLPQTEGLDAFGRSPATSTTTSNRFRDDRIATHLAETRTRRLTLAAYIENKLKFSPYIAETVVLGAGRHALAAVIRSAHASSEMAEKNRIAFTTYVDLASRPEFTLLRKGRNRQRHAAAGATHFASCCSTRNSTRMTANSLLPEVHRSVINEKYADIIDDLRQQARHSSNTSPVSGTAPPSASHHTKVVDLDAKHRSRRPRNERAS
jgi:long-chain acyl-CoA synthetase